MYPLWGDRLKSDSQPLNLYQMAVIYDEEGLASRLRPRISSSEAGTCAEALVERGHLKAGYKLVSFFLAKHQPFFDLSLQAAVPFLRQVVTWPKHSRAGFV